MSKRNIVLNFASDEEFARAAATHIGRLARHALAERGRFDMALSGGESPRPVFSALQNPSLFPAHFWTATHVFFVDERFAELDSPLSNIGNAHRQLLDHVPVPSANVHPMHPLHADPAEEYATELARHFSLTPQQPWPVFDLIVLGMGGDGHTASLFPGSSALTETSRTVVTVPAPNQNPQVPRLTLTFGVLNAAREVTFWVRGAGKHALIRNIVNGKTDVPAASVHAARQSWYICPPLT